MIKVRDLTAPQPTGTNWRKSSYSGGGESQCIEIASDSPLAIPVRDSKDPTGPALIFSTSAWSSFVEAVKRGELQA